MRRKLILPIVLLFLASGAFAQEDIGPPGPNEVHIGPNGVIMPTGRILLVRKDEEYCAIKFVRFWTGKTENDLYATYISYARKDRLSPFADNNVIVQENELHRPEPKWSLFGHPVVLFGSKGEIKCSQFRLWWTRGGTVYPFRSGQNQGDYGIELAPTPWTDISQIDVVSSKIKWYRYDENRKRRNVNIDLIWE